MYEAPKFLAAGDRAIVIELGDEISIECNLRVHSLHRTIVNEGIPGVVDIIPTYRSLLVEYDAAQVSYADMKERLADIRGGWRRSVGGRNDGRAPSRALRWRARSPIWNSSPGTPA